MTHMAEGSVSADLCIDQVEAWACSLMLPQPLDFGSFQVRERHHTVVRVRTSGGLVADCVVQSRGSPIDLAIAELIAPQVLGREFSGLEALREDFTRSMAALETDGVIGRAWSVVEICLQDLRAQAVGWPLWRALGGEPKSLPVLLVEGYALVGETDEAFAERLASRATEGFKALKIEAAHYQNTEELLNRLRILRRLVGETPAIVLDFAWSWTQPALYRNLVDELADLGILWIEDPFPRTRLSAYVELRNSSRVAVGCGDEASRAEDLRALMRAGAIDQLRADATTVGGIDTLRGLTAEAHALGLGVSYHEHPEIHQHCAFAFPGVDYVEVFPTDRPFDRVHDLIEQTPYYRVDGGMLTAPDIPGTGVRLNERFVRSVAKRSHLIGVR